MRQYPSVRNTAFVRSDPSGPVLGATWDPVVDHTTFLPGATIDVLGLSAGPLNVPTPFGTVLCTPPLISLVGAAGVPFAIPIANDCSLLGETFCTQAATVKVGPLEIELNNALDITLGV